MWIRIYFIWTWKHELLIFVCYTFSKQTLKSWITSKKQSWCFTESLSTKEIFTLRPFWFKVLFSLQKSLIEGQELLHFFFNWHWFSCSFFFPMESLHFSIIIFKNITPKKGESNFWKIILWLWINLKKRKLFLKLS